MLMGDMLVTVQWWHSAAASADDDDVDVDERTQPHVSLMYGRIYHTSPSALYASQMLAYYFAHNAFYLSSTSRIHTKMKRRSLNCTQRREEDGNSHGRERKLIHSRLPLWQRIYIHSFIHFWHAPLWVRSAKRTRYSPRVDDSESRQLFCSGTGSMIPGPAGQSSSM